MFNLRRRVATGSLHHPWKRETRMVVAPFSSSSSSSTENGGSRQITRPAFRKSFCRDVDKSCIFGKMKPFVGETLEFIIREEEKKKGVHVTKEDLVDWAKQLNKDGKFEYAFEIFEWMDKKKMEFSPSELAVYVDLICQTKSIDAAKEYFNQVEPFFDESNPRAKNFPAYASIVVRMCEYGRKYGKGKERPWIGPRRSVPRPQFL